MLTQEVNRTLTQVGKGTPMGELLRRYWHPIAASSDLEKRAIKPVRILGEDLVLFRSDAGEAGLIDRRCRHRRADLAFGYVDESGLRCSYHGWCYTPEGACVSQPYDDTLGGARRFREEARILSYKVVEHAGLIFVYMGPLPAPLLPNWELFGYDNGYAQVVYSDVPCNWLQCQENSIDPVHLEWQHSNWLKYQYQDPGYGSTHRKVEFGDFDYGLSYSWLLDGEDAGVRNEYAPLCVLPNIFVLRNHIEWRVPIDDENTLSIVWHYTRVPIEAEPYVQKVVPHWTSPNVDDNGRPITSHVLNQDIIAWAGQGRIADRTKELIGRSDVGIGMLRRQLMKALSAIETGQDPAGTWRSEDKAETVSDIIKLPASRGSRRMTREDWLGWVRAQHSDPNIEIVPELFWLCYGQPSAVFNELAEAAGIDPDAIRAAANPFNRPDIHPRR